MPVTCEIGPGGLDILHLSNTAGEARIALHGAHVLSFRPQGQAELLWLSGRSWFEDGKPIRGGIPICFPWFGGHPQDATKPAHGFARLRTWRILSAGDRDAQTTRAVLALEDDDRTRAFWPHPFRATLAVTVGATLDLEFTVTNTGNAPFTMTEALHTYLAVADITKTTVDGLQGLGYADRAGGGNVPRTDQEPMVRFAAETDRAYAEASGPHLVDDGQRRIRIAKRGSRSSVVWNPWIAKSAAMPDFGDHEWPGMVCVEAANALTLAVDVAPGANHTLATTIGLG